MKTELLGDVKDPASVRPISDVEDSAMIWFVGILSKKFDCGQDLLKRDLIIESLILD